MSLPESKKRRFGLRTADSEGSAAASGGLTQDTPRGLIRELAGMDSASAAESSVMAGDKRDETPRGLMRAVRDVAQTATPSTRSGGSGQWSAGGGMDSSNQHANDNERLVAVAASAPLGAAAAQKGTMGPPPLPRIQEIQPKDGNAAELRPRLRRRKNKQEYPMRVVKSAVHRFCSQLPKPNTLTSEALEALHATAGGFFSTFSQDYQKVARLSADPKVAISVNRRQISELIIANGLLESESLVDAVNRMLDREDADAALGVPQSMAAIEKRLRRKNR